MLHISGNTPFMQPSGSEERYQELAGKWLNNTITPEEGEEFAQWYNSGQDNQIELPENFACDEDELKSRIYSNIHNKSFITKNRTIGFSAKWYAAAAVILVILSTGLYFYSGNQSLHQLVIRQKESQPLMAAPILKSHASAKVNDLLVNKSDIAAGNDKAILTLGDGTKIILDDAVNGFVANQGGNSILKTADGELIYSFSKQSVNVPSEKNIENFNTIQTPKGGKFQVKLPDGTKIWLNAASSLRFPASFTGTKREVELTGEAYFEVAHEENRIFEVRTRDQTVQVLGTHFNINAYLDEPSVKTSLLEGSVRISDLRTNNSQLLIPGEQAKLTEKIEVVRIRNIQETVAWKDGYFQFNDANFQTVMRQIERWYDVKVSYENEQIPDLRFGGEIERSLSLFQVLKILEKTKVRFRLEGRELIVMQ